MHLASNIFLPLPAASPSVAKYIILYAQRPNFPGFSDGSPYRLHPSDAAGPTTAAEAISNCRNRPMQPSHSAIAAASSRKAHQKSRPGEKTANGDLSPSAAAEERAQAQRRHAESIEDLVVEKWVDLPTSQAVVHPSRNRGPGSSPLKNTRFTNSSVRKKDSKENRKTRSSRSAVVLSPHKRDMVRNALLKYRHYFLKPAKEAGPLGSDTPTVVLKGGARVPRELLVAYVVFKHAHYIKQGATNNVPGRSQSSLKPRDRAVEWCLPTGGDGGATMDTEMFEELERMREQLAKTTIEDDYDMTDQ